MCAEFVDRCRADGIPILLGRGVAHGKSIPMLPMLELWRAFFGIATGDSPEATRAKIAGRLLLMDESYRDALPILFDLFGVPDPANPSRVTAPEQRQKLVQAVVKRLLHDPGYRGERVVLLEDLHWFDGASDAFLDTFIESVPATGDLWIVNFRPEYQARWMQRSYYQHLSLEPLGPGAIRALLRDQLGGDASVAALPELIHARTKGNPFFIEEVVQSLVESGHLEGEQGNYRLTTSVDALQVPTSVQAILAARIDRLDERKKQVLQMAAVIGKTFTETLLARVAAQVASASAEELEQALSVLAAAEFLFEAALYPQLEYSFKHPLTQEFAQRSQLRERLTLVHAAVARELEVADGNLDERAGEIAQHWAEAGEAGPAAQWFRHAAEWAGLADGHEALRHWRGVREHLSLTENASDYSELALEACNQILSLGWRLGGSDEEAAAVFADGRALAERNEDPSDLALLLGQYGLIRYCVWGSGEDYARFAEQAAVLARRSSDPALRAVIGQFGAFGHWAAGDGRKVLEMSAWVEEGVGSNGLLGKELVGFSPLASALVASVQGFMFLGRLEEAQGRSEKAERVVLEFEEFEVLTCLRMMQGSLAKTCGMPEMTLEEARRTYEISVELDNEAARMCSLASLGYVHLMARDPRPARDAFRESIDIGRDRRVQRGMIPRLLAMCAEAELAFGARSDALATAQEAVALADSGGCRYFEAEAQIALARVLLAGEGTVPVAEVESQSVEPNGWWNQFLVSDFRPTCWSCAGSWRLP